LPLLAGAAKALDNITKDDMTTLKSFTKPPEAAGFVMEGVCSTWFHGKEERFLGLRKEEIVN
jgi:hypothetical protein